MNNIINNIINKNILITHLTKINQKKKIKSKIKKKINNTEIISRITDFNLTEKSVCIVAYASYMKNKSYGKIIDTYDVVVRINNGINILNYDDFGIYTDIGFIFFAGAKIKLIVNTYNDINKTQYNIEEIINKKKMLCITTNKNYNNYNDIKNTYYFRTDIPYLTSGISSIINVLRLKPKRVHITGFSFNNYVYSDYIEYAKKYKKKMYNRLNKNYEEWDSPHSDLFEKYIVKSLLKILDNITVDSEMTTILNEINIEEFHDNLYYNKTFLENFIIIEKSIKI